MRTPGLCFIFSWALSIKCLCEGHQMRGAFIPEFFHETTTASLSANGPVFLQENNTHMESQVGSTAVLHCHANHLEDNTVTWIRRRDYHLLTVGLQTYSSDLRFQSRHVSKNMDWQLHVRYVQRRDAGTYECQISSHPPISLFSHLSVVEASSEILGSPEKYMTIGSSLRLVCVMRSNTEAPSYVFWYHNSTMINFQDHVRVETSGDVSVLFLKGVDQRYSGNYTCLPSNTKPSHILIHVLKGGETPAAIHSGVNKAEEAMCFLVICTLIGTFQALTNTEHNILKLGQKLCLQVDSFFSYMYICAVKFYSHLYLVCKKCKVILVKFFRCVMKACQSVLKDLSLYSMKTVSL